MADEHGGEDERRTPGQRRPRGRQVSHDRGINARIEFTNVAGDPLECGGFQLLVQDDQQIALPPPEPLRFYARTMEARYCRDGELFHTSGRCICSPLVAFLE